MSDVRSSLYRGHRFPAEAIGQAVWLYFRFPLSLRMVEDLLAARGSVVSHETVRRWAEKFGRDFAGTIRSRAPRFGDKWHLDEVSGQKHWLWRAIDQDGFVLDALVQSRRDRQAAERLLRKRIRNQARTPRVLVTDKRGSYGAARRSLDRDATFLPTQTLCDQRWRPDEPTNTSLVTRHCRMHVRPRFR